MTPVYYAIRREPQGFRLCSVEIASTNFGGVRKFASTTSLIYKRESTALAKAKDFYETLYTRHYRNTEARCIGVIQGDEFRGELATEGEDLESRVIR